MSGCACRTGCVRPVLARLFAVLVTVVLGAAGCAWWDGAWVTPAPGSPTRAQVEGLLAGVRVVEKRVRPGGYERGCRSGQGCVFGPSWSDDHDAPGGHDGCDTRNNVLAAQLREVRFRPGTRDCVVESGTFHDPYTGDAVTFDKSRAREVEIDHLFPLAAAWDLGASTWPPARRRAFANDMETNLVATTASVNRDKGDRTPADWLPPSRPNHCYFAGRYLTVATRYDLPLTTADHEALTKVARTCP
ncbi:uncharacterized protein DUF1524 [Nocardia puris]|uniref:Uncharacterized protein DUF1524 n=1 Tax=Nocardia puris TaxID=208602 RepID=A0A366D8B3_9NOCA|nr:uncharacterized protein DUF1524 [Nocardia puris]